MKTYEEFIEESKTRVPEFKDMVNAAVNYHAEGDVDKTRKYIQAATANLKLIPASELKALTNTAEKKVYDSLIKKYPVLVKDKVSGKLYDPKKEFNNLLKKPEVVSQLKRMGKEQGKGWDKNLNFEK